MLNRLTLTNRFWFVVGSHFFIGCFVATHAQVFSTVSAGVEIAMQVDDRNKIASFAFKDVSTGAPIATARPAAWMQLRRSEQASEELSCEAKAMQLSTGSLGSRADVDLNTYRLVTLNDDSTVAFINPLVKLNNSRLEAIVQLPSKGYDWVLSRRTQRLFISLRETGQIAVIDILQRRLIKIIDIFADALPTRMVIDDDTDTLWIGLDGRNSVLALDARSMQVRAQVEVAAGLHTLTLTPDQPWLWVANSEHGSVSIIHRTSLQKLADVSVGKSPISASWSIAAQRAIVLSIEDGVLSQVDPVSAKVTSQLVLARGVLQAALFDGGRYAITINHQSHRASLIDLASSRVVDEVPVVQHPDQVIVSREFAYVRGQSSPNVTLLNLAQARTGKLAVSTVSLGRKAPRDEAAGINIAAAMALAPEGNGIYIANAADKTIYRYTEGLMAANGSLSNYARAIRGLMVLDTSLSQIDTGVFSASFAVAQAGRYDVVVRNANPSLVACFVAQIDHFTTSNTATQTPLPNQVKVQTDASGRYLFHLNLQAADGTVPVDGILFLFAQQQGWQQRSHLQHDAKSGTLWSDLQLPAHIDPSQVQAMVSAPSLGLSFSVGYLGILSQLVHPQLSSLANPNLEKPR
jgi:DNA-binding beta-propeller fold protein YncE